MNNNRIRAVVILGVISILCILSIQVFLIKKNIDFQEKAILIQNKQDSISARQFNEKISIALLNTAIEIQCVNHSTSDLYGAVKQQTSNYFTVELEDTLHPNLLERILKTEFYNQNIKEDFRYGIYDCFSDSIVYGNYIRFVSDSIFVTQTSKEKEESTTNKNIKQKLNTDVHYFSVIFPNRINQSIENIPNTVDIFVLIQNTIPILNLRDTIFRNCSELTFMWDSFRTPFCNSLYNTSSSQLPAPAD